jgi:hypothetical protein
MGKPFVIAKALLVSVATLLVVSSFGVVLSRRRRDVIGGFRFQVLHNERDSAVGRIGSVVLVAQMLIGKASHLFDLVFANPSGTHDAPGSVGAVG